MLDEVAPAVNEEQPGGEFMGLVRGAVGCLGYYGITGPVV